MTKASSAIKEVVLRMREERFTDQDCSGTGKNKNTPGCVYNVTLHDITLYICVTKQKTLNVL